MNLDELLTDSGEWLRGTGPESDIVISSRVRLARNIRNFNFITRMDEAAREGCEQTIRQAIIEREIVPPERYLSLPQMDPLERQFLVERHLISKEHEDGQHHRGVAIGDGEFISIMVNEEDHVRLQVLQSGLQLDETYTIANQIDDRLEEGLEYAFSPELGYLTACPTNVGTGMRVSVMMHLIGLVFTRHIEKVFQAVSKIGLAVRGLYGEGTEASGHFYQISNQVTLGKTEDELLNNVRAVIPTILEYERKARAELLKKDRTRLMDRVWRAYAILKYSRILNSEESMMLLSAVRMGVHLGLIPELDIAKVNEIFICTQPAHLQKLAHQKFNAAQRDTHRAEYIRAKLN